MRPAHNSVNASGARVSALVVRASTATLERIAPSLWFAEASAPQPQSFDEESMAVKPFVFSGSRAPASSALTLLT